MSYEFDPVYETECLDDAAILAMAAEDCEGLDFALADICPSIIEQATTRTAEGHIIIDMAALVNALRNEG